MCAFIFNSIRGDGATENRGAFKQLGTLTARDVFGSRCKNCSLNVHTSLKSTLLDSLPNDKLPIVFLHLCDNKVNVFIGGELPRWVKKIVNRLERSSYKE